ncbi:MAG: hypothetical protein M3380_18710, partial [Chloroflexota bacterium]|nr:hypothetical protein [Chloroflexota bacterium]
MKPLALARLATLIAALGIVVLVGAFVWLHVTTPSDGVRVQPGQRAWRPDGFVATPLREEPGGIRRGDVIVAVAGQSMEAWAQRLFVPKAPPPRWQPGQRVVYTVIRDGRHMDLTITLQRYPL